MFHLIGTALANGDIHWDINENKKIKDDALSIRFIFIHTERKPKKMKLLVFYKNYKEKSFRVDF